MKRSAYVCQRCFPELGEDTPLLRGKGRVVVSIDFVTADGKQRLRRIHLMTLCRKHADEMAKAYDTRAKQHEYGDQGMLGL